MRFTFPVIQRWMCAARYASSAPHVFRFCFSNVFFFVPPISLYIFSVYVQYDFIHVKCKSGMYTDGYGLFWCVCRTDYCVIIIKLSNWETISNTCCALCFLFSSLHPLFLLFYFLKSIINTELPNSESYDYEQVRVFLLLRAFRYCRLIWPKLNTTTEPLEDIWCTYRADELKPTDRILLDDTYTRDIMCVCLNSTKM